MKQLKVKPWGEGQGDHVLIDESEFNPDFHVLVEGEVAPDRVLIVGAGISSGDVDALRADLEAVNLLAEQMEVGLLDAPKGEGVALRVHKAVAALWVDMEALAKARDEEVDKSEKLQKQIDGLLQQADKARQEDTEAKEVADLKAKLDAAKVTYRSNASKESLQKQVDDLEKA